jgi:serine/threonine protein kinase
VSLASGLRLGPYEILGSVGSGGMGEVYRARDTRLDRDVAIKTLPADVASDPVRRQRFEREARAVAALNHPGLLSLYDVGDADGVTFIVTELLEGETLRDRLLRGPLAWQRVQEWGAAAADALAAAHERGIVHRDLKPENLFLTRDGRLKISTSASRRSCWSTRARPRRRRWRRPRHRPRGPESCWARSATCRPSRRAAKPSTRAATSSRSAACSTSVSAASARSRGTRRRS